MPFHTCQGPDSIGFHIGILGNRAVHIILHGERGKNSQKVIPTSEQPILSCTTYRPQCMRELAPALSQWKTTCIAWLACQTKPKCHVAWTSAHIKRHTSCSILIVRAGIHLARISPLSLPVEFSNCKSSIPRSSSEFKTWLISHLFFSNSLIFRHFKTYL